MWRINNKELALQEVLIMAYMNVLEALGTVRSAASVTRNRAIRSVATS
jgi:hypothetical protein